MVTYGGDEVSAIVLDIGTSTTRSGYAGEETPKSVIPTAYGYIQVPTEVDEEINDEDIDDTTGEPKDTTKVVGKGQDGDGDINMDETTEGKVEDGQSSTVLPTPENQDQDPRVSATASGSAIPTGDGDGVRERKKKIVMTKKYFMGEEGVNVWRKGMEVGRFVNDGIVTDPAPLPSHISHVLHNCLSITPSDHPLLTTEPAWNTTAARETLAEICLEGEGVTGYYVACGGVLSAFSAGKGSALIVDIGSDLCSVVPISDGYALRAGTKRQPLSVTLLNAQLRSVLLSTSPSLSLTPHHLIKSRTPVPIDTAPQFVLNQARQEGTTDSWREWAEDKVVDTWREACGEVWIPGGLIPGARVPVMDPNIATGRPARVYEFPDGYSNTFGDMRLHAMEPLFNPNGFLNRNLPPPQRLLSTPDSPSSHGLSQIISLTDLICSSLLACDIDQRPILMQNIVVVGGGSLIPGLIDRINVEISLRFPGQKVKIHAPGNTVERKYSAWLGGSILASLGTFHQLWVGADEWKEHGPNILKQRCK